MPSYVPPRHADGTLLDAEEVRQRPTPPRPATPPAPSAHPQGGGAARRRAPAPRGGLPPRHPAEEVEGGADVAQPVPALRRQPTTVLHESVLDWLLSDGVHRDEVGGAAWAQEYAARRDALLKRKEAEGGVRGVTGGSNAQLRGGAGRGLPR